MKVRFTQPALEDLDAIRAYIAADNPNAASRVITRLIDRALALSDMPYQGREVDEPNTRVVVLPRLRYFIFYKIEANEIHVTHIRHTSRKRPWVLD